MFRFRRLIMAFIPLIVLATIVTVVAWPKSAHACAYSTPEQGPTPEQGVWNNLDAQTRGIVQIQVLDACSDTVINPDGTIVNQSPWYVTVFGQCHPTLCNWGRAYGRNANSGWIVAAYYQSFATRQVWIRLYHFDQGQTYLRVHVETHFTDQSGRADYSLDDWFGQCVSCVV